MTRRSNVAAWPLAWWCVSGAAAVASAATIHVPAQHTTIQAALDAAGAGDTVLVAPGTYVEKIHFPSSGSPGSPIVLQSSGGAAATILSGAGVPGDNIVLIDGRSHVSIVGFTVRDNTGVNDGSGIRVLGSGKGIEIRDNVIREIRGNNAMGITVYATEPQPIEDLVIEGNEIFDCEPEPSEALVLNGNVRAFEVSGNYVHDVNNIAIDFIGGETDIQPNPSLVAREGVCRDNLVERCGSGFSGGIYIDGGRDIVVESNTVTGCDLGIEVGAENAGIVASGNVVRSNVVYGNRVVGIIFGGYSAGVGRANANFFYNNTLYKNGTDPGDGVGEIWVQYGNDNVLENNLVWARDAGDGAPSNTMVASFNAAEGNSFDYNLYFTVDGAAAAQFGDDGASYSGFSAWQAAGQDPSGIFADPALVDAGAGDLHLTAASPAVDAGNPAYPGTGQTDIDGAARVSGGRVDIGADEAGCGDGNVDAGEQCDDGDWISGDGCDANCTFTACGNAVLTGGEACDDGNLAAGDCCDGACQLEALASACDDGEACTNDDACDGAGVCTGQAQPMPTCEVPQSGGSGIKLSEDGSFDRLQWKWGRGPAVSSFGDPTAGDDHHLCIYDDGAAAVLVSSAIPAGPAWVALAAGSYKYRSADGAPAGISSVLLKTGGEGRSRIKLKARGPLLALAPLAVAPSSTVTVQLHSASAGTCFGAVFSAPFARNDASQLSDKSD
ncbi:MAG TPA: choice-of-anchor Q domain-containing protein [Candidatus Limnocylindrales bacterium]|nr:choice-of-anchor Q domain-containing protein [Candidatus Limnocylindrales bacterium]